MGQWTWLQRASGGTRTQCTHINLIPRNRQVNSSTHWSTCNFVHPVGYFSTCHKYSVFLIYCYCKATCTQRTTNRCSRSPCRLHVTCKTAWSGRAWGRGRLAAEGWRCRQRHKELEGGSSRPRCLAGGSNRCTELQPGCSPTRRTQRLVATLSNYPQMFL